MKKIFLLMFLATSPLVWAQPKSPDRSLSYWRLPGYLNKGEVEAMGGRVVEMPEFNSLYVLWIPKVQKSTQIIVDLPEGLPYNSFKTLFPAASQAGDALVSILSWQGGGNYLPPEKLYRLMEGVLKRLKGENGLDPKRSLLHATGVMAASVDSVFTLDEKTKNRFFKLQQDGKLTPFP